MSDTPTEPTTDEAQEPTTPEAQQSPAQEAAAAKAEADLARAAGDELAAIKAEARKWEAQAKANAEAAKRLEEIEEASKTEAQKQAERLADLESKVKEYETREQIATWAKEVSEETDVPADLLRGSTKEELLAHAEQLKPLIASGPQEPARPGSVSTIGKQPQGAPNIPLSEQIAHAEQARDGAAPGSPEWKSAQERVMQLKGMQLFEAAQVAK